ncbi:MAG: hypothetical protein L0Y80_07750 [Ignavibacteriae bacterium]|nr:hypothetical protein [Ignavibacteriota bacterium]
MKKLLGVASAMLVLGILCTVPMIAQEMKEKEMTVTGEVVDVACYMMGEAKGEGHVKCATACAKAGGSLGILTADGKLYVSLLPDDHKNSPNAILMDHIGHNVEAKGYVRAKGGTQGLMIKSVAMAKPMK